MGTQAAEISATGISVPFFDSAGKLTHKMLAKRAAQTGSRQNLHDVEIHYFAENDPASVVQRLEAQEATWDERKEVLVGRGPIVVVTPESRLTGEGFDFALATSLLHIHRNFTMTNPEMALKSDRATVEMIVEKRGEDLKVRDIRRCEAVGNLEIVVLPTATKTYPFDKAYSEIAIYDGAQQTVTLPKRIRTLRRGEEGFVNTLRINLKDSAPQPP